MRLPGARRLCASTRWLVLRADLVDRPVRGCRRNRDLRGGDSRAGLPVERNPPDPSCAPRRVAGATIIIRDPSGSQVAAAITAADGAFFVALPPGAYVVDPQPVPGLMGAAPTQDATVSDASVAVVNLDYDTGIC